MFLLALGLMELSIGLNDIALSKVAKNLKLIHQLPLLVKEVVLFIDLLSKVGNLILTFGVFLLQGLFG